MERNMKKLKEFLSFWYVRYLLATELYIVEPWEKVVVHVMIGFLFMLFWYFNNALVLSVVGNLTGHKHYVQPIS